MSQAASATIEAPRRNSGKKRTLIIGVLIALLVVAGGTAQFIFGGDGADRPAGTSTRKHDPLFVTLEQFTVNLADTGGERFAQVGVTVEVADEHADKALRTLMPSVRNSVLLLLSSKKSEDLLTLDGKKQLASQIAADVAVQLGWSEASGRPNPVNAVNFSHFIVQ